MIRALTLLLLAQLSGEVIVRLLAVPLPGPVLGMGLMFIALAALGRTESALEQTADALLRNLSLLFVPAAVGVVQHGAILSRYGLSLAVALLVSTFLTLVVTASVFRLASRRFSRDAEPLL